jgi:predicted RNA-binding protein YlxR (DUF448 family)
MAHRAHPERKCICCRQIRPKGELLRLVTTPSGTLVYDHTLKMAGRGSYICPDWECLHKAIHAKRGRLASLSMVECSALVVDIRKKITREIGQLITRGEKMGFVRDYRDDSGSSGKDIILAGNGTGKISAAMRALGDVAPTFGNACNPCGGEYVPPRIIKGDYPFIRDLLRDLKVLERLSSEV